MTFNASFIFCNFLQTYDLVCISQNFCQMTPKLEPQVCKFKIVDKPNTLKINLERAVHIEFIS